MDDPTDTQAQIANAARTPNPTDMPADWWPGDLQISGSHFGIGAQIEIPRHADGRIDMDKFNSTVICVRLTVWQLLQKKKSEEAK